ncbi:MAG: AAA family ATPase, partial [Acidimicrobiales bacterium]
YARQLLHLRAVETADGAASGGGRAASGGGRAASGGGRVAGGGVAGGGSGGAGTVAGVEGDLYSERFLVRRPLLRAIAGAAEAGAAEPVPVLLIDEIDRADDEFEAYLLELLSDFSVTVPELGTFRTERPPVVVITSNRTRDVHDALKRRCLYHWVDHPPFEREVRILRLRVPGASESLARHIAAATARLRSMELYKPPGVAESIDWAMALVVLGELELTPEVIDRTLGTVVKYREDAERVRASDLAGLATAV